MAVIVVFVENIYFLLEDMTYTAEKYSFAHLPIAEKEKNAIDKIISSIYKDNIQIKRKRNLFTFYKVDPPLL